MAEQATHNHPMPRALLVLPIAVGCGNFMTGLDQSAVITSLPAIGRSLGEPPSALGLTMTAYVAALVVALPLGGWASDRFGARRAYAFAALTFTLASALCGVAGTFCALVASRTLQGFGGALMGTVGQVAILSSFPRQHTLKINTYVSLASQVAPMVGPLLGGLLTTFVSWRWIFFINLPIGLVVAIAASRLLPVAAFARRHPFDARSFLLIGSGTALLVLGVNGIGDRALAGWIVAVQLGASIILLGLAVFHGKRTPHSMLDFGLLSIRTFRVSLLTGGGLDTIGLTAVMLLLPLMLQIGFGLSAAQSGSLTFLAAAGSVSVRLFVPFLLRRYGFRRLLVVNTPLLALTVTGFAFLQPSTSPWLIGALILLLGILRSVQWGSTGNMAYADVPAEKLARFSAMYNVLWQVAVALSFGLTSAMLSLLSKNAPQPSLEDFRTAFVVAALITLAALISYRNLLPGDGQVVSGHRTPV